MYWLLSGNTYRMKDLQTILIELPYDVVQLLHVRSRGVSQ
nr:MAG TPA: hypothetical protein [Caudoviricetes sp.]